MKNNDSSLKDAYCIGCGKDNPIGLKLEFSQNSDGGIVTESKLKREFEGYEGIVHGGIISLILDETCAKAVHFAGYKGVTARIKVSFLRPFRVGEDFTCTAKAEEPDGRRIAVKAQLSSEGELKARCECIFVIIED